MKRKSDDLPIYEAVDKSGDKEGVVSKLKRRKSLKKKKRQSILSIQSSASTSSLTTSIASCADSVVSADENQPDNLIDRTASIRSPPAVTPRSSSLTKNTRFFKKARINKLLDSLADEGDDDTPTNTPRKMPLGKAPLDSPLPPTPPVAVPLEETTSSPVPLPDPPGRKYTVSVAIPGSICDNAQSPELRSYLIGQIARTLSIFNVDEVIVFNDKPGVNVKGTSFEGVTKKTNPNIAMLRILQYLETPQYLRKALFPMHPDLKYAGLLNPLDCPHHMRSTEEATFREGVVVKRTIKKGKGSYVDCGIDKEVQIDKELKPGTRVTVRMDSYKKEQKHYKGKAVSPNAPRTELGLYWGYRVRLADNFSAALLESCFREGYDLTIGTSDTGENIDATNIRHFKHALICLGGLSGLEPVIESDETLKETSPRDLFDYYLNTCPNQGSRTIRTEEALQITLAALRPQLSRNGMN